MNLIKRFFGFFFGFNGRIGRLHFAIFLPFLLVIYVFIVGFLSILAPSYNASDRLAFIGIVLAIVAIFYVLKYSHLTRRVHDLNKKAMDSSLFTAIFWVDIISTIFTLMNSHILRLLSLPLALISILCIIILAFKKGDQEENNFGKPQIPFWKK